MLCKSLFIILGTFTLGIMVDYSLVYQSHLISNVMDIIYYEYVMMALCMSITYLLISWNCEFGPLELMRGKIFLSDTSYLRRIRHVPSYIFFVLFFSNVIPYFTIPLIIFTLSEMIYLFVYRNITNTKEEI